MKKIKKLLTIGLAVLLMLCMSVSLVGCDWYNPPKKIVVEKYFGIVQRIEGNEELIVYIPEFGVCEIPSYENDVTVKENDLICLEFAYLEFHENLEVKETCPAQFSMSARKCEVRKENVEFEIYGEESIFTIDLTEKFKNELTIYGKDIGDVLYFMGYRGTRVDENGLEESIGEPIKMARATIVNIGESRLTIKFDKSTNTYLKGVFTGLGNNRWWLSTPENLIEMGIEE